MHALPRIDRELADILGAIALDAGAVTLRYRGCEPEIKADGSPVTIADREAEALIVSRLSQEVPGIPVVSEEAASAGLMPEIGDSFFLVDALDGTKEYVSASGEFTVNIALVHHGVPVAAALFAPALHRLWLAGAEAEACDAAADAPLASARNRRSVNVRPAPPQGLIAVASLRHSSPETENCLARFPITEKRVAGSSLKFCLLAEGIADLYPRYAPTMEWDTAAGHAILGRAGGAVVTPDGRDLAYGKREAGFLNPHFLAVGDRALLASEAAVAAARAVAEA